MTLSGNPSSSTATACTASRIRWWKPLRSFPSTRSLPSCTNAFAALPIRSPIIPSKFSPACQETLQYLSERHHLIMMTKGNLTEQSGKVERSGLKEYFSAVEIVAEKDESTLPLRHREVRSFSGYDLDGRQQPQVRYQPRPRRRLARRLHPHGSTWILEHEEVATAPASQRLLVVDRFGRSLTKHF
jgi:putative hydrolase of the HAD superfamily